MTLPSFIIIGAHKCGTASLYNYMIEHPQILPAAKKELHFFNWFSKAGNRKKAEGVEWYLSQFPTISNGENFITGEATPDYLVDPHTPQKMFKLLPDVKLIVLLRNPVDRAISHYHHNRGVSKKREPLPFKKAIEKESERLNQEKEKLIFDENYRSLFYKNYSYLERGIYIEQLEIWMNIFPREQFLILKSEDFFDNPNITLKEVFNFLDLPNYELTHQKQDNELSHQPIDRKTRSILAKYFQPYNQRLEEYLAMKFNWDNTVKKLENQENKSLNVAPMNQQVSNKNLDKLSVTKIQQSQKKNQKILRKIDFKYLVVGMARSGTTFMARALRSVGIRCGHEKFFGGSHKPQSLTKKVVKQRMLKHQNLKADSSWLAVPFLNTECVPQDVSIIHLTRHPQKVIESIMAIGFFRRKNYNFYTDYVFLNTPEIKLSDSELTKCCKWYLYWNRKIEESGRQLIHYRVEDPLEKLFDRLNLNYDRYKIFNDTQANSRRTKDRKSINLIEEIEEPDLLKQIVEMAERYGYSIEGTETPSKYSQQVQQENPIKFDKKERDIQEFDSKLAKIKDELQSFSSIAKENAKVQKIEENLVVSGLKSPRIVIEKYDQNIDRIYNELFWGYEIQEIQTKTNNQDTINISGWVLGKNCPVVAIEIVEWSRIVKKVSVNQPDPDVVKLYPEAAQVKEIGFSIDFSVNELPPKFNWLVQAVFADGTQMSIACLQTNDLQPLNIRDTPLLTRKAVEFIKNFFPQKPDAKVLEFGSGASTIWLSKLTKNLTSIEHDGRWFQQVKNQIETQTDCNPVDFKLLPRPYHTICEKFPEASFDLIIVDGRDRMKCFEASIKLLKPGGIIVLDDAQRQKYQQAQDLLKDWHLTKTITNARHTYWWQKPFSEAKLVDKSRRTPSRRSKSRELEKTVIAGVSMVKDEEDIIYYTLAGNYRQGVKKFVMLDHLSSDTTRDEIRRFADDYPEAMVYLIEDRDPLFHKYRKMSAAAEFAHTMWGAEWIFPFDADEVISSSEQPLTTILSQFDPKDICVGLQHRNHIIRSFYDLSEPNPLKRMTYRKKEDTASGEDYSKVIIRWQPGMEITQGHHAVKFKGKKLPVTILGKNHGLILRQYRYRSREQMKQKIINGGKAYEITPGMKGIVWTKKYTKYQKIGEKFIDRFYNYEINGDLDAVYDPAWV
ncbi:sulfotransferase domain-containing protein [Okeania sp.]|uniref:sulfotransferase domain-containing protein n=1 Tax=Okeania sp. TaxID=3100323 RepID=UPI002B4B506E|nr:sulfotransferase domain-containing protein [Okeania sp.]MEB3343448.1 sulfotransferase domain-containing protein [Okeania sp.]